MPRVVVFGGAGFLGSHVADALVDRGYDVVVFDQRPSPYLRAGQQQIVDSLLNRAAVAEAVKGCQFVYNFAGISDIEEAEAKPLETVEQNVLGNSILLEACRNAGVERYLFASTIYVFSDAGSFYRASKQACELFIESYQRVCDVNFTVLRYGSIYGARAGESNWIHRVLTQALTERRITREGDGEAIREYIHVADAARCSVEVLESEFVNEFVTITGAQPMKIKDVLEMIREMAGAGIEIEYVPVSSELHYRVTPYSFRPRVGKRYISRQYVDLGQGIFDLLQERLAAHAGADVPTAHE
jgi:UDP-glucose 4-epimerase